MRPTLFVLAAGVCLAGLSVEPDGPIATTPAVAKPVEYDTLPAEPKPIQLIPPAVETPTATLPAATVQPVTLVASAPRGMICGPFGCGPAASAASGPVRRYASSGRWYPGKRVVGFFRGRRR